MKKRGILVIALCMFIGLVYAGSFEDKSQSDFNGTFNDTFYNSSGFIQMNETIMGFSVNITVNISEMIGNESGIVSYWRFNESSWSGTNYEVKDVLGKNNGTAINVSTVNTTQGLFARAGNFSGVTGTYINEVQIVNSNELNPGTGSFTITGWAKSVTRGGNGYQLYVAKRDNVTGGKNGYYIGLLEGSGIKFVVGDGTNRVDTAYVNVNYTKWFYFAAVINRTSNQSMIYINGTLGASVSISTVGNINNSWNLSIGNDEGQALLGTTYQYPVKGQIDEVAIWNRALNSFEILELYNKGLNSSSNLSTNSTYFYNGTYESIVKDAGSIVSWDNISWNDGQIISNFTNVSNYVLLAHFDEISGAIVDSSDYSNNGTNNGALYNVSGKVNSALSFDGINDYVDFGNPAQLQITKNITLSSWVKFNQIPTGTTVMTILSKNEGGGYGIIANENLVGGLGRLVTYFYINGAYKNAGVNLSSLSSGVWYHVLAAYNGTSVDFYLDGAKQESVATSGEITNTVMNLFIGANPGPGGTGTEFFNGTIDEVYVFNRSLNFSEIGSLSGNTSSNSGLKFQIRTSNDNSTWTEYEGNDGTSSSYYTSPGSLNLGNSRYLQYTAFFTRESLSDNPKLHNISIDYTTSGENISVSLDSPGDNYLTNEYNINVTCSVSSTSQLSNVTVYYDKFGWAPLETKTISGTSNTTNFLLGEIVSPIAWNCRACSVDGNCRFADSNRTIIGDILSPEINAVFPEGNYTENSTSTVNFVFNATDNRATSLSCKLFIDDTEVANNSSVLGGVNTIFNISLSNGNYFWKINCSDGINSKESESRNLTINYTVPYIPFWAKVNTHTHTTNSDGDSSPATVVGSYKAKGYNLLAITDHGFITNCTPFTNSSFICINSEEWTSTKHVVRINVSATYNNAAINLQNAVNAAQNEGGFSIAAHPNWTSTTWTVAELTSLQNYTAMEIYNKVIERLTPDPYAVKKWDEVLKTGKKIFGVAADDMHQANVDLGYGFTKVYMPEFTPQAYLESMKTGLFYSSQGPSMDSHPFNLVCDETISYHMGETANCSAVKVNATVSATNSSYVVRNITLIKDGEVLNFTSCATLDCNFSYSENVSSSGYYRLQATDSNNKQIWSNPIWVNKIAQPVVINVYSPINNSNLTDYTPLINVSLNQQTSLWYNINGRENVSLCSDCYEYFGYLSLPEGQNIISIYANNSDNIVRESQVFTDLNFNKSTSDSFEDNSSIISYTNVSWNIGRMSMAEGIMFGNFILKTIYPLNNITGFYVTWEENNTENARGEGQRVPIILKYKIGNFEWQSFDSDGNYITNGSIIEGLNGNNLSLMFDFEKNPIVPIDLLEFRIAWTEFTVPLMSNVSATGITSSSAIISWVTDLNSNSTVFYGTTTSLGNAISSNVSTRIHSLALSGLNPSTGYFYKVQSCTESSCSQSPQEPYTPYSITTQAVSVVIPPSSGGSGGGGGGGGIPIKSTPKVFSLEIDRLPDMVIDPGQNKKIVLKARNNGTFFLNECKLIGKGDNFGWISSSGSKGLSAGEEAEFTFNMNVPDELKAGSYSIELFLGCIETNSTVLFKSDVIEKNLKVTLVRVEKNNAGKIRIVYALEELSNINQNVQVTVSLINKTNDKVAEFLESKTINALSRQEFEVGLIPEKELSGTFNLLINALSDTSSAFVQEEVVLGESRLSGLSILDSSNKNLIFSIVLIAFFLVFAGLVTFRILRFRGFKKRTQIRSVLVQDLEADHTKVADLNQVEVAKDIEEDPADIENNSELIDESKLQAQGIPFTSIEAIKKPF